METLRLILLCVAIGAVVGMFAAHLFGFLFWVVLALGLLGLGVRLWPRLTALLASPSEDIRTRR